MPIHLSDEFIESPYFERRAIIFYLKLGSYQILTGRPIPWDLDYLRSKRLLPKNATFKQARALFRELFSDEPGRGRLLHLFLGKTAMGKPCLYINVRSWPQMVRFEANLKAIRGGVANEVA